ncbi:MAG: citrate/2-methylcitrate synthase [Candidatus Thorarchaeota archaeon]
MTEPICRIDVDKGLLLFRGIDATRLAANNSFVEVLDLIVTGVFPNSTRVLEITKKMAAFTDMAQNLLQGLFDEKPKECEEPLSSFLERMPEIAKELNLSLFDSLLMFVTYIPIILTRSWRLMQEREPLLPDSGISHPSNILQMLDATNDIEDFECCLILHMDDPNNPSLTTLENELAKGVNPFKALQSTLSVHVDTLHHGAGTQAMRMINELRNEKDIRAALNTILSEGGKIYGLGHRIYRTIDPRAAILSNMLRRRSQGTDLQWLHNTIEEVVREGTSLLIEKKSKIVYPNVDLYNAAVYSTFGIDAEFNTYLFAIARSAGWMAHIIEHLEPPI